MRFLAWFNEIPDEELMATAGGKGASLCRMSRQKLPVPEGFIVSSSMFNYFMESSDLSGKIQALLNQIKWDSNASLNDIAQQIRKLISNTPMPLQLAEDIKEYYQALGENVPVAVRSSGTVEDLEDASCAGQQDTYLFVVGLENVVKFIKECWASLYNDRAIFYRHEKGFGNFEISIAVVVQKMVNAEKAGVMFSANPINGNKEEVIIEAAWGLGESVVQGIVTPDNYWVNKGNYQVINQYIAEKETMVVRLSEAGGVKEVPVPPELSEKPVLSEEELKELVDMAIKVETFYGKPQDLEWAYENNRLYLLQSRPITTLS
ncbi:MAG: PEP/pyruvate-binding domain-containing protein [Zhaonellaceae bacterium]|jgi:pyruvate,water dikinase